MGINSVNLISDNTYKELFQVDNPDFIHLFANVGSELEEDVFSLLGLVNVYAFKREAHENEKSYFVYTNDVSLPFLTMLRVKYRCVNVKRGVKDNIDNDGAVTSTVYFIIC